MVAGKQDFGISAVHERLLSHRGQTYKRSQSLSLNYGVIFQLVFSRGVMHISVFNLIFVLTDFPPERVPCQEDVFHYLSI